MKNIAIIYHDADFDGKLSNEVCRYHLKRLHPEAAIHSYGWDYGRPVPSVLLKWWDPQMGDQFSNKWEDYDAIYIVDLSVDELMARPELRSKIVWIDHHKSAIEKWDRKSDVVPGPGMFQGFRIDGVAACRLCWNWFVEAPLRDGYGASKKSFVERHVPEPELIRLAGEYDVWDHRDPDGKALQFGLRTLDDAGLHTAAVEAFNGGNTATVLLRSYIQTGHSIKSYCDKQNDEYSAAYSQTIKFAGLTMCALNIGQRGNSDLARGGLKPEHQAIFAWRHTGKGEQPVMVSLYHAPGHEDIDLSVIATKWGGGGHKGACGFRVRLTSLDTIILLILLGFLLCMGIALISRLEDELHDAPRRALRRVSIGMTMVLIAGYIITLLQTVYTLSVWVFTGHLNML
jgi:hypothetical protein